MPGSFSIINTPYVPTVSQDDEVILDREVILEPCPFCQSLNVEMMVYPDTRSLGRKALIHCKDCDGSGPVVLIYDTSLKSKNAVVEAWNKSAQGAAGWSIEEIEHLRDEVVSLRQQLAEAAENFKIAMEALTAPEPVQEPIQEPMRIAVGQKVDFVMEFTGDVVLRNSDGSFTVRNYVTDSAVPRFFKVLPQNIRRST